MEEPYTATTAWHLLLILVTSLVTHCCGMASQSSSSICQPTWLCWLLWHEQHAQADPTSVQWGLGQDCKGMKMSFNSAEEANKALKSSVLGHGKEDPRQDPQVLQGMEEQ